MKFQVIEGGRSWLAEQQGEPTDAAVRAEAKRRLGAARHDEAMVYAYVTGRAPPAALTYYKLQIEFAAAAICRLDPIPDDFRSDFYWPVPD